MEVNVRDDKKIVDIWLTNAEQQDPAVSAELQKIYDKYRGTKYTVAVFRSGREDLYESTLGLLAYNRRRSAEKEVQRNKRKHAELER